MTTQKIAETIRLIAPKFAPDSEDISWLANELDKVATKTLPKLVRKRFAASFRPAQPAAPTTTPAATPSTKPASAGPVV